jgi:hypothetical protein
MTVKQLIAKLQALPQSHQVIINKHSGEGSPLSDVEPSHYIAETTWSGHVVHPDDVPDYPEAKRCVVLWAVN